MRCKHCKQPMRESKRSHHKKRKWVCPHCGRARMQQATDRKANRKERLDDH